MASHIIMMPFASQESKCLLHYSLPYGGVMDTPADRLKLARERAGYKDAKSAAEAMGAKVSTYLQHENGTRGLPASRAQRYGRFFRAAPEWLLYGKGTEPTVALLPVRPIMLPVELPSEEALTGAWRTILRGIPEYPTLDLDELAVILAQHSRDALEAAQPSGPGQSDSPPPPPPKRPRRGGGKSSSA